MPDFQKRVREHVDSNAPAAKIHSVYEMRGLMAQLLSELDANIFGYYHDRESITTCLVDIAALCQRAAEDLYPNEPEKGA